MDFSFLTDLLMDPALYATTDTVLADPAPADDLGLLGFDTCPDMSGYDPATGDFILTPSLDFNDFIDVLGQAVNPTADPQVDPFIQLIEQLMWGNEPVPGSDAELDSLLGL
jgi:hypothetical protein